MPLAAVELVELLELPLSIGELRRCRTALDRGSGMVAVIVLS